MKWGVIGTGNMGGILIESWMESEVITDSQLHIYNRTFSKTDYFKKRYPNITVHEAATSIASEVDLLFICVKPLDITPVLKGISPYLNKDQCIVSITSPYQVEQLEQMVPCQAIRMIPSITNRSLSGISLVTFGTRVSPFVKGYFLQSLKRYSKPVFIDPSITRVASDIVSCGPAFFSYLTQRFVRAAVEETKITEEEATEMAAEMLIGLGNLLEKGYFTLPELQAKVCVKGGVTGEGIKVLENEVEHMFHHLFQKTHKKYDDDLDKIAKQLNEVDI
ncbi:late competence protein ComER [Bacillaceae bacterium S4-13-58]